MQLYDSHWICYASMADISGVVCHFKLTSDLYRQCKHALESKAYWQSSIEYKQYWKGIKHSPVFSISSDTAEPFSYESVVNHEVVTMSQQFEAWLNAK